MLEGTNKDTEEKITCNHVFRLICYKRHYILYRYLESHHPHLYHQMRKNLIEFSVMLELLILFGVILSPSLLLSHPVPQEFYFHWIFIH